MTTNIEREISRNVPRDIPIRFSKNITPLLTAFGCVLLERDTGKSCVYTAVNLKSGKREVISRRPTPLTTSGVEAIVEKIRLSSVAGAGRLEADRPFGEKIAAHNCREILAKEQRSLAEHILDAINRRSVSLAEAEVVTEQPI